MPDGNAATGHCFFKSGFRWVQCRRRWLR
jgi:hypothetical protein